MVSQTLFLFLFIEISPKKRRKRNKKKGKRGKTHIPRSSLDLLSRSMILDKKTSFKNNFRFVIFVRIDQFCACIATKKKQSQRREIE